LVSLNKKEYRIGGAGNVALNCQSLGADVSVLSITGDDSEAIILNELLESSCINTSYLIKSNDRITTNKIRVISRNQQMMRLDAEIARDLSANDERQLLEKVQDYIAARRSAHYHF
jgi:bifunctional ADP-heptose synthase (sugar kinase/adenylyltransferase)